MASSKVLNRCSPATWCSREKYYVNISVLRFCNICPCSCPYFPLFLLFSLGPRYRAGVAVPVKDGRFRAWDPVACKNSPGVPNCTVSPRGDFRQGRFQATHRGFRGSRIQVVDKRFCLPAHHVGIGGTAKAGHKAVLLPAFRDLPKPVRRSLTLRPSGSALLLSGSWVLRSSSNIAVIVRITLGKLSDRHGARLHFEPGNSLMEFFWAAPA